jgi:hypothetical protein
MTKLCRLYQLHQAYGKHQPATPIVRAMGRLPAATCSCGTDIRLLAGAWVPKAVASARLKDSAGDYLTYYSVSLED